MTVSRETGTKTNSSLSPEAFAEIFSVSRETTERLRVHLDLLIRWQSRINLVGASTLADPWRRHMLDSAQIHPHLPTGPLLDMGSGAGFPGLVLAILRGEGSAPVHLVEADTRKSAFLREAIRVTEAPAVVHQRRMEDLPVFPVAALTARALAPLSRLLVWAERFLAPGVECLFLKGREAEKELTEAADLRPPRFAAHHPGLAAGREQSS